MTRRPFCDVLRKMGFERTYRDSEILIFAKRIDNGRRIVQVQLWADGGHRACHDIDGCSDTAPTDFDTIEGMKEAIETETLRTDNGWLATGHKDLPSGPLMILI